MSEQHEHIVSYRLFFIVWFVLLILTGITVWIAQYNLGAKYANGEGVKRDYVRAHMWWNLAASRGNYNAPYSREKIENEMTTQQVQTARRLAVECEARRFQDC